MTTETLRFFLHLLYQNTPQDALAGTLFGVTDKGGRSYYVPSEDVLGQALADDEAFDDFAGFLAQADQDIWFNVGLRDAASVKEAHPRKEAEREKKAGKNFDPLPEWQDGELNETYVRGGRRMVSVLPGFAIDFDIGGEGHAADAGKLPSSLEEINEMLTLIGLPPPTIIVSSGHGYHYWWRFTKALINFIDGQSLGHADTWRNNAAKIQNKLKAIYEKRGYIFDITTGPERIWRLPGTYNRKIPGKPKLIDIHHWEDLSYDADEFFGTHRRIPKAVAQEAKELAVSIVDKQGAEKALSMIRLNLLNRKPGSKLYDECKLMLAGKSFAHEGARDNTLTALAMMIVNTNREARELDAEVLADHFFAESVKDWTDEDWLALAVDKILTAQTKREEEDRERHQAEQELENEVAGGDDKGTYLRPDGVIAVPRVVRFQNDFYCFDLENKNYGPRSYTHGEITQVCRQYWGENEARNKLYTLNDKGKSRIMTPEEIVENYGIVAEDIRISLYADRSHYNSSKRIFYIAHCPIPDRVVPVFNPDIDEFIGVLFGKYGELGRDWLSVLPFLDEPCTGLYLEGPSGAGKSLFAKGCASLWGKPPTAFENIFGGLRSKFAHLEGLPITLEEGITDTRGITACIRKMLTQSLNYIEQKGKPPTPVEGYYRLIISANNPDVITEPGVRHTHSDSVAILQRIAHVYVQESAADFLFDMKEHMEKNGGRLDDWIDHGHFANHIAWLSMNRQPHRDRLYCTQKEPTDWHVNYLLSTNNIGSYIFEWISRFCTEPVLFRRESVSSRDIKLESRIERGEIILRSQEILDNWTTYIKHKGVKTPSIKDVNLALETLCERRGLNYVVKLNFLDMFVKKYQVGDWNMIQANLKKSLMSAVS